MQEENKMDANEELLKAVYEGSIEGVDAAIRRGGDVNHHQNAYMATPLFCAAVRGDYKMFIALVDRDAKPASDQLYSAVRHCASHAAGHLKIVKWFAKRRPKLVNTTVYGGSALTAACDCESTQIKGEVVKVLLAAGAGILFQDMWGRRCDYHANQKGHDALAQTLTNTCNLIKACQINDDETIRSLSWEPDLFHQAHVHANKRKKKSKPIFEYVRHRAVSEGDNLVMRKAMIALYRMGKGNEHNNEECKHWHVAAPPGFLKMVGLSLAEVFQNHLRATTARTDRAGTTADWRAAKASKDPVQQHADDRVDHVDAQFVPAKNDGVEAQSLQTRAKSAEAEVDNLRRQVADLQAKLAIAAQASDLLRDAISST